MTFHLEQLEREAIDLIRDICFNNDCSKIVCFYSIGKDSSVLLHLFKKAFHPFPIPIRFLHIDTGWKFKEMYEFRDEIAQEVELLIYKHPACLNPFVDGARYTDVMKTEALKEAVQKFDFKIAFGGARRDEEKSRAKERMVSVRNEYHKWDPRSQNSEIPPLYNPFYTDKSSLRVFPLSNWTELDIWEYIKKEKINVVPLYFAKERKVIKSQNGLDIATYDNTGDLKMVRFRTLGCYPLTGSVESNAQTVDEIITELKTTEYTERITRAIDYDTEGSMEKKKKDGYF